MSLIEWKYSLSDVKKTPSSFLCACDVNDDGAKKFTSFGSFSEFENFYKKEKVKYYYEIIQTESKSKLYLDLDIPNVTINIAEKYLWLHLEYPDRGIILLKNI